MSEDTTPKSPERKSKSRKIRKLRKSDKKKIEIRDNTTTTPYFIGYDGLPVLEKKISKILNLPPNYYSSTEWREPVDVDGATTTEVFIDSPQLSSLAVHDLYWQASKVKEQDGKPKGFLQYSKDSVSDGKPKGFLSFLENSLPDAPKQRVNIIPHVSSQSILHFLENFSNHSGNKVSQLNVDNFKVPKIKKKTPRSKFISKLGGILPNNNNIREDIDILNNKKIEIKKINNLEKNECINEEIIINSTKINKNEDKLNNDIKIGRDWNAEFQYLLERLFESEDIVKKMRDLCQSFATVAKEIGTIIISELFCPPEDRTIPPVTETVGGVAGGEKYVYKPERIFFKFAVDHKGIYGGTEYIMKASGHEINSLMELMDCRVQGLHFPLMVLVDYRGYRLIAMPLLPIGLDTLVYGSDDGGRNIQTISCEFNARMQLIASILNLAGHDIWNLDHSEKTTVFGPVDIEGHLGRDDRFYILDTARLFPPAIPVAGLRGCHLYRLLRPELVKNNPIPLCSDAYSTWDIEGIVAYNQDVADATAYLENEVIPQFGDALQIWLYKRKDFDICDLMEYNKLKIAMHRRGINMRCAGLVRQNVHDNVLQKFILTEIVARVAKKILFGRMRQLQTSDEYEIRNLVIDYFNLLFDYTMKTAQYWCISIKNSLLKRFSNALHLDERDHMYDLRESISLKALFIRLQDICSIKFSEDANDLIYEFDPDMQSEYSNLPLFNYDDLIDIYAAERSIHQIDFAEGTMLSYRAVHSAEDGADELFELADERFRATIERKPDDYRALHNWALSLLYHANRKQNRIEADELYSRAYKCVTASIILDKDNASAYLLWGNILTEQALKCIDKKKSLKLLKEATKKYSESFRCEPKSFELCYNWGNTYLYIANNSLETNRNHYLTLAGDKYKLAISIDKKSSNAYLNWGIVLSLIAKLDKNQISSGEFYLLAEKKFEKSLQYSEDNDSEILINWGNVHYQRAQILASIDNYKNAYKQLVKAGNKFMHAVRCGTGYNYDALLNWGKVLILQMKLNPEDKPSSYSLTFMVELYFAIFSVAVINEENTRILSLNSIIEFYKSDNLKISTLAIECLYRLSESHIPLIKLEAGEVLEIIKQENSSEYINDLILNSNNNDKLTGSLKPKDIQEFTQFFKKIESTRTSLLRKDSNDDIIIPLTDFQTLSDNSISRICYTVFRKGTSELYVLKIRKQDSSLKCINNNILVQRIDSKDKHLVHDRMSSIINCHVPFISNVLHSYRRDNSYYLIEEFISEDRSLSKLRQTGKFKAKKAEYLIRSTSMSEIKNENENSFSNRILRYKKQTESKIRKKKTQKSANVTNFNRTKIIRESLPESIARFYICEIIIALSYIHSLGFIYGNLTPTTIHIDYKGHICLTKFYYFLDNTVTLQDEITTTAPEILSGGTFTREADWFSVGIILHEFLTGNVPPQNYSGNSKLSSSAKSLISKLLHSDPKKRLGHNGVVEIKDHPFFVNVNWEKAENMEETPPMILKKSLLSLKISYEPEQRIAKLQESGFHQDKMVEPPDTFPNAKPLHTISNDDEDEDDDSLEYKDEESDEYTNY